MLLKQPEDSNLNLPVWDPRVSTTRAATELVFFFSAILINSGQFREFCWGKSKVKSATLTSHHMTSLCLPKLSHEGQISVEYFSL